MNRYVALFSVFVLSAAASANAVLQPDSAGATSQPADEKADAQTDREAKLKKQLKGVVLLGYFQMTNEAGLRGDAPLTKPSIERYEIEKIVKASGDHWVVTARIQYADRDVFVPVPVRIVWAEGTPIITLDKMKIPLIGEYSARVVISDGFYAGTWTGATYGGVLSGQIISKAQEAAIEKMEKDGWNMGMPGKQAGKQGAGAGQRGAYRIPTFTKAYCGAPDPELRGNWIYFAVSSADGIKEIRRWLESHQRQLNEGFRGGFEARQQARFYVRLENGEFQWLPVVAVRTSDEDAGKPELFQGKLKVVLTDEEMRSFVEIFERNGEAIPEREWLTVSGLPKGE